MRRIISPWRWPCSILAGREPQWPADLAENLTPKWSVGNHWRVGLRATKRDEFDNFDEEWEFTVVRSSRLPRLGSKVGLHVVAERISLRRLRTGSRKFEFVFGREPFGLLQIRDLSGPVPEPVEFRPRPPRCLYTILSCYPSQGNSNPIVAAGDPFGRFAELDMQVIRAEGDGVQIIFAQLAG